MFFQMGKHADGCSGLVAVSEKIHFHVPHELGHRVGDESLNFRRPQGRSHPDLFIFALFVLAATVLAARATLAKSSNTTKADFPPSSL